MNFLTLPQNSALLWKIYDDFLNYVWFFLLYQLNILILTFIPFQHLMVKCLYTTARTAISVKKKYGDQDLPANLFLIVILQEALSVISLSGGRSFSVMDFASIRTFCHWSSLNISICPLSTSFSLVFCRSSFFHSGVFDSTKIFNIWK